VEFVFDQTMPTWIACHERAFGWFGGVMRRVVIDNLKAGVLQAHLHDPVLGESYRRLAQHSGFVISPNRPRTPRHKGKVESGIHYVKRNFLAGRTFADLACLNDRVRHWVMERAGQRVHGTTREAPLARFHRAEQAALQRLPEASFDLIVAYRCKVHRDCHVVVDGRYYSVPYRWIGKRVDVYVGRRVVEIYEGTDLIATHPVVEHKGQRQTRTDHYPESKRAYLENPPARCRERGAQIGEACAQVVETLLSDRVQDRLRSVQALLRLREEVGGDRLEKACKRALHYGDPSYRRIKTILQTGMEAVPVDAADAKVIALASYQFARPASTFFEKEVPSC
jgi:hypothetical protein